MAYGMKKIEVMHTIKLCLIVSVIIMEVFRCKT